MTRIPSVSRLSSLQRTASGSSSVGGLSGEFSIRGGLSSTSIKEHAVLASTAANRRSSSTRSSLCSGQFSAEQFQLHRRAPPPTKQKQSKRSTFGGTSASSASLKRSKRSSCMVSEFSSDQIQPDVHYAASTPYFRGGSFAFPKPRGTVQPAEGSKNGNAVWGAFAASDTSQPSLASTNNSSWASGSSLSATGRLDAFAALMKANSGSRKPVLYAAAAAPSPGVDKKSSMKRTPSFIPSVEAESDDKLLSF
mmetsp:Transcript_37773/g.90360  ORF Transcript_37773/g.90360 Transcript_37773/m.90360 type:complete len:251 (+) Transcript_37773:105-857(+)